jgi:hypothetical protein
MIMKIREFLWLAVRSSVAFRVCQIEEDDPAPPQPPHGPMIVA